MNGNSKMYLYLTKITNYKVQVLKVGYVDKHMRVHEMHRMQKKNWNIKIHNPKTLSYCGHLFLLLCIIVFFLYTIRSECG